MTESRLWLVNHCGSTFSLSAAQRQFRQLPNTYDDVVTVKRVSASHWCAWAVGHDHRPYLYVLSSDVPIRISETTYENQRWSPFHGFSKKGLIRSDRFAWSDETGTVERPKESIRLPSAHWEWDDDWMIDDNLRGEVVTLGGWQYALDFPALYTPEQHWNSFVRRRKWIHFRRYSSTDVWAGISDMEMVENSECFIDISVGGFLLPSQPSGFLSVWAVMNSGSVYVRTNVHRENPEGSTWHSIQVGEHQGIINISVGATNLVWAVTWDGQGLVRTNVSRSNVYGSGWVSVEYPDDSTRLMQVAVGRNAVWAISRDGRVWFRKGTWGDNTFWRQENAVGSVWVEMVGEMSQISLSSNDQVFAVDTAGQAVYFRTAVSRQDLTGKTWQKVTLREDFSQFRDLGLFSDGQVCSCGSSQEGGELCELHDVSRDRNGSGSTSCSSVSLPTTISSPDDSVGNNDVFLTPLQPAQPAEISRMLSMADSLPPAWVLGEDIEVESPETPTSNQIPNSFSRVTRSASENGELPLNTSFPPIVPNALSRSPSLPSVMDSQVQTSETDSLDIPEEGRVRSVSDHSLADSQPRSSKTVSPASSTGTVQHSLTLSVSSQTIPEISESGTTQRLALQENPQTPAVPDEADTVTGATSYVSKDSSEPSVGAVIPHNQICDQEKTGSAIIKMVEGVGSLETSVAFSHTGIEEVNLTEVDRDLKLQTELMDKEKPEENTHTSPSLDCHSNVASQNQESSGDIISLSIRTSSSNSYATASISEEPSFGEGSVSSKAGLSFPESDCAETKRVPCCEDSQASKTENKVCLSVPEDNKVYLSVPEVKSPSEEEEGASRKRRPSKSRRRESVKIQDISEGSQEDSIVFKPVRKKKEKTGNLRAKSRAGSQRVLGDSIDSASIPDEEEPSGVVLEYETSQKQRVDETQRSDVASTVTSEPVINDCSHQQVTDGCDYHKEQETNSVIDKCAVSNKQSLGSSGENDSSSNISDALNVYEHSKEYEGSTSINTPTTPLTSQKDTVLSQSNLLNHKSSKDTGNIEETVIFNQCDQVNLTADTSDSLEKTLIKIEEKSGKGSEAIDDTDHEKTSVSESVDKVNSRVRPTLISVSSQTEGKLPDSVLKKGRRKKPGQADSSTQSIPMTKLTPSLKKFIPLKRSSSTEKVAGGMDPSDQAYSDAGSDEIADFVTDLLSDEEEEEKDKNVPENNNSQNTGSGDDDSQAKSCKDEAARHHSIESSGYATQDSLALSRSITGSLPTNGVARWSFTGTATSRSSPSAPTSLHLRKTPLYRQSPSPASLSSQATVDSDLSADTYPGQAIQTAQPRLCWRWLDATSCIIDDPSRVDWLSRLEDDHGPTTKKPKISKHLRQKLLKQITARNLREVTKFKSLESAVERTTWVYKASMEMYQYGRQKRWLACSVELEQGIGDTEEGSLTVHYTHRRRQKHTQVQLCDMTCVKMSSDPDLPTAFSIYTSDLNLTQQPLMLKPGSEKEASEWLGYLSFARADAWNLKRPIMPGAVWSCSFTGDILVSPSAQADMKPYGRCWGQHGGHMALVETSPSGVTWGLGFDKTPHVYNGGFGGAVSTGQSDMSGNTQQMVDSHRVYVYENQKWFPLVGWCNKGVFTHKFHWVTSSGQFVTSRDQVKLPSSKWHWTSDWTVDFGTAGGVDSNGWQYSKYFSGPFHPSSHLRDHYRRRRWVRRCRISLMGPWMSAGSLALSDLSIQIDPVELPSDPVVMWAVAANGDVLCRYGVTPNNPMGQNWVHVATDLDKPFTSISVGARGQVWGVAADGSAWYRTEVNPDNPAGKHWLQVVPPPPGNFRLRQVSVGALAVWAVDNGDNLWRRENITVTFPEGTGWELVTGKIKRVSVGPLDQVWIVADAYFQKSRHGPGVIYHRQGITEKCPAGKDWQLIIGSGWAHVSVRGATADPCLGDSSIDKKN